MWMTTVPNTPQLSWTSLKRFATCEFILDSSYIDFAQTKIEHGDDDTITDDVAAQVFVEQFALETLQRADNAMKANKASR